MMFSLRTIEDFVKGEEVKAYIDDLVDIYELVDPIEDDALMGERNAMFHDVDDDSDEEDLGGNQDYGIFHDMDEAPEEEVLELQAQVEDEVKYLKFNKRYEDLQEYQCQLQSIRQMNLFYFPLVVS